MQRYSITEDQAFEMWLRLKVRDLRTLQRQIERSHKMKIPMNVLSRWRDRGQWVEKAIQVELLLDAEVNQAAWESIQGRQVRRRAESMEIIGGTFDTVLRLTAGMVETDAYRLHYGKVGSPDVLLKSLTCLEKLGKLYQSLLPMSRQQEEPVAEEDGLPLIAGQIDPIKLANQLTAFAKRKPVLELRADVKSGNDTR